MAVVVALESVGRFVCCQSNGFHRNDFHSTIFHSLFSRKCRVSLFFPRARHHLCVHSHSNRFAAIDLFAGCNCIEFDLRRIFARDIRPHCRTHRIDSRCLAVDLDLIADDMAMLSGCQSKNLSSALTSFRLIWQMQRHSSTTSEFPVKCLCSATDKWDDSHCRFGSDILHRHFSNIDFCSDCDAVNR